jgi:sugar lactone lactonase YvrE
MTEASVSFAGNLTDDPEPPGHLLVVIVAAGSPSWRCIRGAAAIRVKRDQPGHEGGTSQRPSSGREHARGSRWRLDRPGPGGFYGQDRSKGANPGAASPGLGVAGIGWVPAAGSWVRGRPGQGGDDMAQHSRPGQARQAGRGQRGRMGAVPGHLYWTSGAGGTINVANLDGSSPRVLVGGQDGGTAVAVDPSHLYWTNTSNGTINQANLDGSNPRVIVSELLSYGVAVDASHLYWADIGAGTINVADLDGTNPQALVTDQNRPWGLAVDASHLYWTNAFDGTIWRANLDGSSAGAVVTGQGQDNPTGVAVDPTHLYWANSGSGADGTINQANLDGTSPRVLVGGQNPPAGVAVDPTYVYWVNPNGGTVNQAGLDGSNPHALVTRQNSYGVAVGP